MKPLLYLAIDNCFAAKRWCEPAEWMRVVDDLGLRFVEASADNEIDPLYSCPSHLDDWLTAVGRESEKRGIRVVNLYSGHGTYSTLGLGHYDQRVRNHLIRNWVRPMLRMAGALGAGLGFYAHAFAENVLCDPRRYARQFDILTGSLRKIARVARDCGVHTIGIEQMYAPHQIPWTIDGARDFLRSANATSGGPPVYLTIDTGHQTGQDRFRAPTGAQVRTFVERVRKGQPSDMYVGPAQFYRAFEGMVIRGATATEMERAVAAHAQTFPYLFSSPGDGDPYEWLRNFGAYSPIIHLQQTDGKRSAHSCFTAHNNRHGRIRAEKVLAALKASFDSTAAAGFPPRVKEIYLTLEPFLPTACHPRLVIEEIRESVEYWRRFLPRDGTEI